MMFWMLVAMAGMLCAAPASDGMIDQALESVVGLYVERPAAEDYSISGMMPGIGSGVIVDPSGLVLTNAHVVDHSQTVVAQLNDGTKTFATVIGVDTVSDLALLQLEPRTTYPAMAFGDSSRLRIGSPVTAIGNPFGLTQTVTAGIVSGLHRSDHSPKIQEYIQLDASINPGNSGGALVDAEGRLVGINTAILSTPAMQGNIGIGFAIPVEIVWPIYQQLKKYGHTSPGFLGVVSQNMNEALAKAIASPEAKGVMVTEVIPGSPAETAGLRPMDVLVSLNDVPVHDSEHVRALVVSQGQDATLKLKVIRQGKPQQLSAVTKRPPMDAAMRSAIEGVFVVEHDEMNLRGQHHRGLRITQIQKDSPALLSGLLPGDVILSVNGKAVHKLQEIEKAFASKQEVYFLQLQRDHQRVYVALHA